jgi:hypothetical protein
VADNKDNEYESSDEEEDRAGLEIGGAKVKDIKEVQKQRQMAKDA